VAPDAGTRQWLARNRPGRRVRWGSLRRTSPFSERFGLDRGLPVDRVYIAQFLGAHAEDVRGSILEVSRPTYARLVGRDRATSVTIVDIDPANMEATLTADLCEPGSLPEARFDCVVLTQTLHLLPDIEVALDNLWSSLVPGGVLLITVPALSRDDPIGGDYWRFTPLGLRRALQTALPPVAEIGVEGYGNVLACAATLFGLSAQDVGTGMLQVRDPSFPVVACARVRRPR
jgi:SAM-dependent methyltransferase